MSTDLKSRIMTAALEIAARVGITATSRNSIAASVECSTGSVSFHYGDGRKLSRAIVERAIATSNYAVMGAAIAERHASAAKIPDAMRATALRAWIGK
jgi:AcrR family transcriptional regulator